MAQDADLLAQEQSNKQTLDQVKADLATLVGLVDQLVSKISPAPSVDLSQQLAASQAVGAELSATDTDVQSAIAKAKAALGQ